MIKSILSLSMLNFVAWNKKQSKVWILLDNFQSSRGNQLLISL